MRCKFGRNLLAAAVEEACERGSAAWVKHDTQAWGPGFQATMAAELESILPIVLDRQGVKSKADVINARKPDLSVNPTEEAEGRSLC